MSIPHLFRCPISLDLLTDPVTLSTGQTYDRSSIEKWLADGNLTCPVTMQRLHDLSIIPNHTLRHLIEQWLLMDAKFDPENMKAIDPMLSLATLKHNLQSKDTTFATRLKTFRMIKALSEESDSTRARLIQLGFFPLLLELLFGNPTSLSQQDSELAEEALNCVLNLSSCTEFGYLNMLKDASNLASFLVLLDHGNIKIKISLCHLVDAISSSSETRELCYVLGRTRGILQWLVSLLNHKSDSGASDAGTRAISGLCSLDSNRENVIREGGVDGLITYLSNADRPYASRALATLELLLELESGKRAAINNPNVVRVLVKMIFRVSDPGFSESAVGLLLVICYESLQIREAAVSGGVLTQLLLLLQSQCTSKAKNKARVLLKLLRPKNM